MRRDVDDLADEVEREHDVKRPWRWCVRAESHDRVDYGALLCGKERERGCWSAEVLLAGCCLLLRTMVSLRMHSSARPSFSPSAGMIVPAKIIEKDIDRVRNCSRIGLTCKHTQTVAQQRSVALHCTSAVRGELE